ncbi:MAG: peptidoglycan-binding domain-containing protein [Oscillospiraceae bacterium]
MRINTNKKTSLNDNRQNVIELQIFLRVMSRENPSVPLINPDGVFGSLTGTAVKLSQGIFDFIPTGRVDYETWTELYRRYSNFILKNGRL